MATERRDVKRVEVGFSGGQAITLRLTDSAYEELRKAVQNREGWYEIDSSDGVMALDLSEVVFVKREHEEHRVGFAGP